MSAKEIDMSPKALLNEHNNYVLQHQDVYDLLKYVWTGVFLPVTEEEFQSRVQLSDATMKKLSSVINPLIVANADAQAHCKNFKDKTYPSIVSLASDVYNYAQSAGGDEDDSYYLIIIQSIKNLPKTTDAKEKEELKKTINGLLDLQVENIGKLLEKAQKVVAKLSTFEGQTKNDQKALEDRSSSVKKKLSEEMGDLDDLEKKLGEYRDKLAKDTEQYDYEVVVAATTPTYVWAGLIGFVSAVTVAIVYGISAQNLSNTIEEVNKLISSTEGKVNEEKALIADINSINNGLKNVLDLIGPAIRTIEKMMGIWQSISDDLKNLKIMTDEDIRKSNAAIAKVVGKNVVKKWNDLKDAVDKYRKAAYITEPERKSLEELSKELKEAAKKTSPVN